MFHKGAAKGIVWIHCAHHQDWSVPPYKNVDYTYTTGAFQPSPPQTYDMMIPSSSFTSTL